MGKIGSFIVLLALCALAVGCYFMFRADPANGRDSDLGGGKRASVSSTPDAKTAAGHANRLGLRVFQKLAAEHAQDNLILSGAGLSVTLASYLQGLDGNSYAVLADGLGYGGAPHAVPAKAYSDLSKRLHSAGEVKLTVTNRLFVSPGSSVNQEYETLLRESFETGVVHADLAGGTGEATVNDAINDAIGGMLPDFIPAGDFQYGTSLVLVNAMHFKGQWIDQFDRAKTGPGPFYPDRGEPFSVELMRGEVHYSMYIGDTVGAVRLPYKGGSHSMVLMAGVHRKPLSEVRAALTPEEWARAWDKLQVLYKEPSDVTLPKFKLTHKRELQDVLSSLGMADAFAEGRIDRSRMHKGARPEDSQPMVVLHGAAIDVDEAGTTAATATAVYDRPVSADFDEPAFVPHFNRPFLFAIVDHDSGAVLFMGQVVDPRKE